MSRSKPHLSPFALPLQFTPGTPSAGPKTNTAVWFIFYKNRLLVKEQSEKCFILHPDSPSQLGLTPDFSMYLGRYDGADIYTAEISPATVPLKSLLFKNLRSLFGKTDDTIFSLAGRAIQIIHWNRDHTFCGRCGAEMTIREHEIAKICPACSFTSFPRLSPAVIMSVTRGNEILLARSPGFPAGMYSTLAGFVEPGETLEEAVAREVREEVNVEISNITYMGSQPWPFPHSLMIGFSTCYSGGNIKIDNKEIEDAGWFSAENLPPLPSRISIARYLIDSFLKDLLH